jgi:HPt (histidine-containing phosphotransfer) domain-containing protein
MIDLDAQSDSSPVEFQSALELFQNDAGFLERILKLLLAQALTDLPTIQEAVTLGDSQALAEVTHRLKGSLSAVCAVPSFAICTALHKSAHHGSIESYVPQLRSLERELARLKPCIEAWLAERAKTNI